MKTHLFSLRFFLGVPLIVGLGAAACARGESDDTTSVGEDTAKTEPKDEAGAALPPKHDAASPADGSADGQKDAAAEANAVVDAGTDAKLPSTLATGLVFDMTFDSATAVDATGNHPPSVITASSVTGVPDRFGNPTGAARFFASPASLIQVGPPNVLPIGGAERSMAVWVKPRIAAPPPPAALPNSNVFVHWGIDDCTSKMFGLGNRTDHGFAWTGCVDLNSSLAVPVGAWTFMAVTYKFDGTLTLIVGGSRQTVAAVTLQTPAASPLAIGGERKTYGQGFVSYFDGDLDDLRIWSRVLTDPELAALAADQ